MMGTKCVRPHCPSRFRSSAPRMDLGKARTDEMYLENVHDTEEWREELEEEMKKLGMK